MDISIIVAKDRVNCIGKDNTLAWDIPEDMQWFRRHTLGKSVIMGRKTFESIGRPLPARNNIIVSRTLPLSTEGVSVVRSVEDALSMAKSLSSKEVMIIGGGEIYKVAMAYADKLYITEVDTDIVEGDTYFPVIDPKTFTLISSKSNRKTAPSIEFKIYKRK